MQLSDQPRKVPLAFAENGEKEVIPEGSSPFDGRASLNDGFPPQTRQALDDDGIPPNGLDMNGILYLATAINRWQSAGGVFSYDDDFATDPNVGGYPKGAMLLRADGTGFWVSLVDDNDTDPDGGSLNWQPFNNVGIHLVTMTSSDVTLTTLESARDLIIISGALTANVNLIFPVTVKQWLVVNNTTGAFTVTCKTSGTGGVVQQNTSRVFYGDGTNLYGVSAIPASQAQVDAGTEKTAYVTSFTFENAEKWDEKADLNGSAAEQFSVDEASEPEHAVPLSQLTTLADNIKLSFLQAIYPVGTPYFNRADDRNPNAIFGVTVGTWVRETGKFMAAFLSGDDDFGVLGNTGGAKDYVMTLANLISHHHDSDTFINPGTGTGIAGGGGTGPATTPTSDTGSAIPDPIPTLPPFVVYSWWYRTA